MVHKKPIFLSPPGLQGLNTTTPRIFPIDALVNFDIHCTPNFVCIDSILKEFQKSWIFISQKSPIHAFVCP